MRVFDRRYEIMPRAELEQMQLERIQSLLVRLKRYVRQYRDGIGEARVRSLDDFAGLPLTSPEDMAASFPYGMFALPLREVIRLHSTVGPQGNPLVIGHTRNDLVQWARLVARQLVASGVTANDVVQVCLGGSTYRGASGYVLGAELIEASVIAEEPMHIDSQVALLENYRPTTLITTPTTALELMRAFEALKLSPQSLQLRTLLLTRPVDAATREQLRAGLHVTVRSNYGIHEVLDPGLCVECDAHHFHVNEDQFYVENIDGELVITTLCREAIPLLRYRTRVACEIVREKCACGRTGAILRPGPWLDGRLRINEIVLFERQIHEVLGRSRAAGHPCMIQVEASRIIVSIDVAHGLFSDMMWQMIDWRREIETEFHNRLGIDADVRFVSPR